MELRLRGLIRRPWTELLVRSNPSLSVPGDGLPNPSRFHAGNGAFVFSCPNGEWQGTLGYSIWIGAKSETPLSYLRGIVDDSWEYQAI